MRLIVSAYSERIVVLSSLLLAFLAQGVRAQEADQPFSAELALTSDYRFKGQSQSDHSSAVQADVSYTHASGAFIDVWGSTSLASSRYALTDIDPGIGYAYAFSDRAWTTLLASYYWSRSAARAGDGYFEGAASYHTTLRWVEISAEVSYSPNYSYHSGQAMGVTTAAETPISFAGIDWLTASTHLGYQWIDNRRAYGTPSWVFYDIGLTGRWRNFALDARFTGTNTRDSDCFGGTNLCDGNAVLTLSANN